MTMNFGRTDRLKDEIVHLKYRIADLEERLCPCEQHEWMKVDCNLTTNDAIDWRYTDVFKCKRCGKVKKEDW